MDLVLGLGIIHLRNHPRITACSYQPQQVVVLTVDISGSMSGGRIRVAVAGVKQVLMSLCPEDMIAILTFNVKVRSQK